MKGFVFSSLELSLFFVNLKLIFIHNRKFPFLKFQIKYFIIAFEIHYHYQVFTISLILYQFKINLIIKAYFQKN
jgi:hypothetical protein